VHHEPRVRDTRTVETTLEGHDQPVASTPTPDEHPCVFNHVGSLLPGGSLCQPSLSGVTPVTRL
jgi:hypothetical protein